MIYDYPENTVPEKKVQYLEEEVRRLWALLIAVGVDIDDYNLRAKRPRNTKLESIYLSLADEMKHNEALISALLYLRFTEEEAITMSGLPGHVVRNIIGKIFNRLNVTTLHGFYIKIDANISKRLQ